MYMQPKHSDNNCGILLMIWLAARIAGRRLKRLFTVQTLVDLEKRQGQGSGERGLEDQLLDKALERNPHQLHIAEDVLEEERKARSRVMHADKGVLLISEEASDEHHR
jgi:hypothetical protein